MLGDLLVDGGAGFGMWDWPSTSLIPSTITPAEWAIGEGAAQPVAIRQSERRRAGGSRGWTGQVLR